MAQLHLEDVFGIEIVAMRRKLQSTPACSGDQRADAWLGAEARQLAHFADTADREAKWRLSMFLKYGELRRG